jgi:hypothetical protein
MTASTFPTPLFTAVAVSLASVAAATQQIELSDGSILFGRVVSCTERSCTIETEAEGRREIDRDRIRSFADAPPKKLGHAVPVPSTAGSAPDIESLQKSLASDPQVMDRILSLQEDPEIQEILNDPEIMNAVARGDLTTLMANPRFLDLLDHPTIRDIQQGHR